MEYETINKETPEMKQLISGIREVSKRLRKIAQTHRPLFGGEIYLTGREVCERLFVSPRTLQDYRDKGIIPYTQIARELSEIKLFMTKLLSILWLLLSYILSLHQQNNFSHEDRKNRDAKRRFSVHLFSEVFRT